MVVACTENHKTLPTHMVSSISVTLGNGLTMIAERLVSLVARRGIFQKTVLADHKTIKVLDGVCSVQSDGNTRTSMQASRYGTRYWAWSRFSSVLLNQNKNCELDDVGLETITVCSNLGLTSIGCWACNKEKKILSVDFHPVFGITVSQMHSLFSNTNTHTQERTGARAYTQPPPFLAKLHC